LPHQNFQLDFSHLLQAFCCTNCLSYPNADQLSDYKSTSNCGASDCRTHPFYYLPNSIYPGTYWRPYWRLYHVSDGEHSLSNSGTSYCRTHSYFYLSNSVYPGTYGHSYHVPDSEHSLSNSAANNWCNNFSNSSSCIRFSNGQGDSSANCLANKGTLCNNLSNSTTNCCANGFSLCDSDCRDDGLSISSTHSRSLKFPINNKSDQCSYPTHFNCFSDNSPECLCNNLSNKISNSSTYSFFYHLPNHFSHSKSVCFSVSGPCNCFSNYGDKLTDSSTFTSNHNCFPDCSNGIANHIFSVISTTANRLGWQAPFASCRSEIWLRMRSQHYGSLSNA